MASSASAGFSGSIAVEERDFLSAVFVEIRGVIEFPHSKTYVTRKCSKSVQVELHGTVSLSSSGEIDLELALCPSLGRFARLVDRTWSRQPLSSTTRYLTLPVALVDDGHKDALSVLVPAARQPDSCGVTTDFM